MKKEDTQEGIKYIPLCPREIGTVTSEEQATNRTFFTHDLVSRHKNNLFIKAHVDYYGGYAEHGRQILFGLAETGKYNLKLIPLPTPIDIDPITFQRATYYANNANVYNNNAILLTIAGVGHFQEKFIDRNKINVGWTMTESVEYPKVCHEWLNNPDYLLCPTDLDVLRASNAGVPCSKLIKVHLGFDEKLYHGEVEPINIYGMDNRFVFGVVGSWNTRKSVREIVRAYINKFTSEDNVSLLLVCKYGTRAYGVEKSNGDRWTLKYEFSQLLNEYKDREDLPHITLIDLPVHESVLPHIFAKMDCLVGFSKGESTWLPGIQAMNMGIPIIQLASKCSGFMEYLNQDNSYLCEDVQYIIADDELVLGTSDYFEGMYLAHGNVEELSEKMSEVYETRSTSQQNRKIANAYTEAYNWTWNKSIQTLDTVLNRIYRLKK